MDRDGILDPDDDDMDGDGIPNEWEVEHGLDPKDPADNETDTDVDDLIAIEEYTRGTDPTAWDTDGDGLSDGDEVDYGLDPTDADDLNDDLDGDGIPNGREVEYGLDPNDATDRNGDLDGDGMPNGWEFDNDLDPTDPEDAMLDPDGDAVDTRWAIVEWLWVDEDGDGIKEPRGGATPVDPVKVGLNIHEYMRGTDPNDRDTDNDCYPQDSGTMNDFDEIVYHGTNATMWDTDTDGMPDGWEVYYNFQPKNSSDAYGDDDDNLEEWTHDCDPFDNDTDGDGCHDDWEVLYGFDPSDPDDGDDDPDGDGMENWEEFEKGTDPRGT
jgi:hypothetical protein